MFGIGLPEFILIMIVALLVVGPDKLPGLARTLGKQVLELKKAANSLKDSLQEELVDEKKQIEDLSKSFDDLNSTISKSIEGPPAGMVDDSFPGVNPPPEPDESKADAVRDDESPAAKGEKEGDGSASS